MSFFGDLVNFGVKATCFTAQVGAIAVTNTAVGAAKTICTAIDVTGDICNGDFDKAGEKLLNRAGATAKGLCNSAKAGAMLIGNACIAVPMAKTSSTVKMPLWPLPL